MLLEIFIDYQSLYPEHLQIPQSRGISNFDKIFLTKTIQIIILLSLIYKLA